MLSATLSNLVSNAVRDTGTSQNPKPSTLNIMSKISCKICAVHGDLIEVEIEGRKIELPANVFPAAIKEKDEFQLYLYSNKYPTLDDKQLSKSILEEILNGK